MDLGDNGSHVVPVRPVAERRSRQPRRSVSVEANQFRAGVQHDIWQRRDAINELARHRALEALAAHDEVKTLDLRREEDNRLSSRIAAAHQRHILALAQSRVDRGGPIGDAGALQVGKLADVRATISGPGRHDDAPCADDAAVEQLGALRVARTQRWRRSPERVAETASPIKASISSSSGWPPRNTAHLAILAHLQTSPRARRLGSERRTLHHRCLRVALSRTATDANTGGDVERAIPFLRSYTVFNAGAQIDGLPHHFSAALVPGAAIDSIERAETFFRNTRIPMKTGGDRAYYAPPPILFKCRRSRRFATQRAIMRCFSMKPPMRPAIPAVSTAISAGVSAMNRIRGKKSSLNFLQRSSAPILRSRPKSARPMRNT